MTEHPLIPIFPLPVAVLPGEILPLHIFEDRYKEMIASCRANAVPGEEAFGVLLTQESRLFTVGCTVSIHHTAKEYEDGRLDIVTVGARRYRVVQLFRAEPYLTAAVEYIDDAVDSPDLGLRRRVLSLFSNVAQRAGVETSLDWLQTDSRISFRLAAAVLSEQMPKQHLLELTDENERLSFLGEMLEIILANIGEPEPSQVPRPGASPLGAPPLSLGDNQ